MPLLSGQAIAFAANYGFAALMAILFWRYIKRDAKEMRSALRNLNDTLGRVEKQLDRLERDHRNK